MRPLSWFASLLLLACAQQPAPKPQPDAGAGSVTGRVTYTTRPDTLPPRPVVDPRFEAAQRRYDSLAALVDTIVVLYPDSIVLHVGQLFPVLDSIKTEARRRSGEVVPTPFEMFDIEDRSIALPTNEGLRGQRAGRTRLVITVMHKPAHAPPTYVPVRVVP